MEKIVSSKFEGKEELFKKQDSIELFNIIDDALSSEGYFSTDVKALETAQYIINLGYHKTKDKTNEELIEIAGIIDAILSSKPRFGARKAAQEIINLGYHK